MAINYNPIMPSSLVEARDENTVNFEKKISDNTYLRIGVVVDIFEVDDEKNISKIMPEYDVMTIQNKNTAHYKNCIAIDGFGGIADFSNKKMRKPKDSKKVLKSGSIKNQNGTIVLLLCIDGSTDQGVIIGSVQHPDRKAGTLTKDLGHHMEGEFNGVNWKIDKDGALTVTFKSATDNDGKPQDTKAGGSSLKMEKDGSLQVSDGNKETIRLDKTNKTIAVTAESDISLTSDANVAVTAKSNIQMKSTADLLAEASGSISLKSAAAFNIKADAALDIKAAEVKITSDAMVTIKGTQLQLSAPQVMVGDGGSPAIVTTTQFLGIGNLGAPVLSQAIGPFSSSVFIAP